MGYQWGLGLHFVFATILLVATINTCLGARNLNSTVACFEHERLALLKFKDSVRDDYGMLSSWVGYDCCRWERVMCDGVTGHVDSLHLRGDDVSHGYLESEELCTSLGELRHLIYLDLSGNYFEERRIPEFIGSLKQLTYLNLSDAGFSGIIPHHIGNLSNLKYLDLSTHVLNELMAHDMTWISSLPLLEHLDLSCVDLSGARNLDMVLYMIPSLKVLRLSLCCLSNGDLAPLRNSSISYSNIKHLDLSVNYFNGPLTHFFQNVTSLHFLDLSSNNIDFGLAFNFANFLSMFPSLSELGLSYCNHKETRLSHLLHNFTTLTNIRNLDLSSNMLTGSIPESLRKLKSLRVLDLSSNKLTCPIPTFLGKLTELYLSSNYMTCSIPESIRKIKSLQVLDLSGNNLTGPIPMFPWKLTELYLYGNYLNGSIPEFLGRLDALTNLFLEYNQLSGTIPVSIGQLSKLRSLDVSHNDLEGVVFEAHFANHSMLEYLNAASNAMLVFNVSREWQPPFQNLIYVNLNSCKIINGFPQWLRNQRKLLTMELSNATISGPLPTWLRKMPIIPVINLSHNNLSGPLTNLPNGGDNSFYHRDFGEPRLYLQNNNFNGSIPRSLCKRGDLDDLDLSINRLTGEIPKCFKNMSSLQFLKLRSNRLSGIIPSSIVGRFSSLRVLQLNDNNFSGELPVELWNLSWLLVLDLGNNAFRGEIPEQIREKNELESLWILRLHNNNFTGRIPRSLCNNVGLQILDIAHNNFTGTIPRCLGELRGMVRSNSHYMDFFHDGAEEEFDQVMKGTTLKYTKTWYLVSNMDLSSNKLVGEIPVELTALQGLVGLNLSNNHLTGGIPNNIGNMTALSSLDLSGNKLDGPIPPNITALTFLSYLNLSNNNLSGPIPTGNQFLGLGTDPSIYAGNKGLCGAPLPKKCSHQDPTTVAKNIYEANQEPNKVWFYADITCGFATGFWGVIVVLMLKKQWRHKLFIFAEESMDKIHVAVMVRVNKMKRGREAK